jgi:hypothetical protein
MADAIHWTKRASLRAINRFRRRSIPATLAVRIANQGEHVREVTMFRVRSIGLVAAVLCAAGAASAAEEAAKQVIPNFTPNARTGWVLDRKVGVDDLVPPPAGGPGPVTFDKAHPYVANGSGRRPTYRVADLSNPILQPWTIPSMKKANDDVLAGKVPFRARERCWPYGVPNFDVIALVEPYFIYQTPDKVVLISQGGPEVRHIWLNVSHSKNVTPSWYGESVGHYENGDTLVVDTIGISTKSFIDSYSTPHTDQLHVVERFRLDADGMTVDISIYVEDPGAFATPWSAVHRWRRIETSTTPFVTNACSENNGDFFSLGLAPVPEAAAPDF